MIRVLLVLVSFLGFYSTLATGVQRQSESEGTFSGRVAKLNPSARLIRVKVDFTNMRYLTKHSILFFWNENVAKRERCKGYLVDKSSLYLLIRVADTRFCRSKVSMRLGTYLKLYSPNLVANLKQGKEVIDILLKKRVAVESKLRAKKREVAIFMERLEALNQRYETLRTKLEQEWKEELSALEEDQTISQKAAQDIQRRLNEIDYKLERYKISDKNLKEDRWALDSRLYYRK